MTDLCLMQAIITDGTPLHIFGLTSGIFVLWKILLIQLKKLTQMTPGSLPNDKRQWLG